MIKTVAFDLDYTLHDDHLYWQGAFEEMGVYLEEIVSIDRNSISQIFYDVLCEKTPSHRKLFDDALGRLTKNALPNTDQIIRRLVEIYRNHKPELRLYPEVVEVLEVLQKDYTLAMITNGTQAITDRKLAALNISSYFEHVICPERDHRKPHDQPYREILERFQIAPQEFMYVGDNPEVDFGVLDQLPIAGVRVDRGPFRPQGGSPEIDAPHVISDLRGLIPLLEKA